MQSAEDWRLRKSVKIAEPFPNSEQLGSRQQVHTNWSSETTGQTQGRVATAFPQYVNQFGQHIDVSYSLLWKSLQKMHIFLYMKICFEIDNLSFLTLN